MANDLLSLKCTSDDACKAPCAAPVIRAEGVKVSPSEAVQEEARRRFGDAHCISNACSCAVSVTLGIEHRHQFLHKMLTMLSQ